MVDIKDNVIYITRGDVAVLDFSIENYTFETNDLITFSVYNSNGLNKSPLLKKEIKVTGTKQQVEIVLNKEDTENFPKLNNIITYWYEIELNGVHTVLGYEPLGASKFILLPKGVL